MAKSDTPVRENPPGLIVARDEFSIELDEVWEIPDREERMARFKALMERSARRAKELGQQRLDEILAGYNFGLPDPEPVR